MKPQPSRPPFVLVPLLLLVGMGLIWGMAGCGLLPPEVVGMFFPPRREAASENVNRAVKSLAEGDLGRADYFIAEAVRGYGEPLSGGVAAVARQLTRQGRAPRAVQLIESITERRPDIARSPVLLAALADAYSKAGDNTRATQAGQNAQRCAGEALAAARSARPPAKPEVLNAVMEAAGFWEDATAPESGAKAIQAAREALRLLPDDPQTLNLLGYLLADKGTTPAEWRESLTLTRQALTLVQKANAALRAGAEPVIADSYGWALFRNGDFAGARRVLAEAVEGDPDEAALHYHLGATYHALARDREAAIELDRALLLQPDFAPAEVLRKTLP